MKWNTVPTALKMSTVHVRFVVGAFYTKIFVAYYSMSYESLLILSWFVRRDADEERNRVYRFEMEVCCMKQNMLCTISTNHCWVNIFALSSTCKESQNMISNTVCIVPFYCWLITCFSLNIYCSFWKPKKSEFLNSLSQKTAVNILLEEKIE